MRVGTERAQNGRIVPSWQFWSVSVDDVLGVWADWFTLWCTPGVGSRRLWPRLEASLSARSAMQALPQFAWRHEQGHAHALAAFEWAQASPLRQLLFPSSPSYPKLWRQMPDPPLVLWAEGQLELLNRPTVALVGARRCSPLGRQWTHRTAQQLSSVGISVVSGLASGIDAAAHEGALAGGGGTVALLGHGLDHCYPPQHGQLLGSVRQSGLALSEFAPSVPPVKHQFPMRNRLIAGLSHVVVVVEAMARSGSLITARSALELGREVMAVPGFPGSPLSDGPLQLLRDGAGLATDAADVLSCVSGALGSPLPLPGAASAPGPGDGAHAVTDPTQSALLNHLVVGESGLDELVAVTGRPVHEITDALFLLEMQGLVAAQAGDRWLRLAP